MTRVGLWTALALAATTVCAQAGDKDASLALVEISGATGTQALPPITCADGEEGKIFVGQEYPDGRPDTDAIRIEVTPTILPDGRVRIRVVSLGVELGDQPDRPAGTKPGKAGPEAGIVFHSALPADGLFSVAGQNGYRIWMRLGQKVDGWSLSSYDQASQALVLTRSGRTLRLNLSKPSIGEPPGDYKPRIETVTVLPGETAEIAGKDGHRVLLKARVVERPAPGR